MSHQTMECHCATCFMDMSPSSKNFNLTNSQLQELAAIHNKHKGLRLTSGNTFVVVDPSSADLVSYEQRVNIKSASTSVSSTPVGRYAPSGVDISGKSGDASFALYFSEFSQGTSEFSPFTDGSYICGLVWANGEDGFGSINSNYTCSWDYFSGFALPDTCLKFGFGDASSNPPPALANYTNAVTSWTEDEKKCMRTAIEQWAYLSGMPIFEEDISGNTDAEIQNKCNLKLYICTSAQTTISGLEGVCWPPASSPPGDPDNNSYSGYLMMVRNANTKYWGDSLNPGGYGYNVALHELGHGMGYAHPFDTGGGYSNIWPNINTTLSNYQFRLDNSYNQNVYSTMTYAATSEFSTYNYYVESSGGANITPYASWTTYNRNWRINPAPVDCALYFEYYGYVSQTGDTNVTYYLDPSLNTYDDVGWVTINDRTTEKITIDASGIASDVIIDLRRTQLKLMNDEFYTYGIANPDLNRMSYVLPTIGSDLPQGGYSIGPEVDATGGIDASSSNVSSSNTSVYSNVGIPTMSQYTGQLGPSTIYGGAGTCTTFYSKPQGDYTFEASGDFMKIYVTSEGEGAGSDLLEMSSVNNVAFTNTDGSIDVVPLDQNCFAEGTKIMVLDPTTKISKYVRVETLRPGHQVVTYKHGPVKILSILSNINIPLKCDTHSSVRNSCKLLANASLYMLRPEDHPELKEPLYLTGGHSLLKVYLTKEEKRDMATIDWPSHFYKVDGLWKLLSQFNKWSVPVERRTKVYNLILEQSDMNDRFKNYGIYANGMLIESCNLEHLARGSQKPSVRIRKKSAK